jgi:phosphoribosylformimino-5-aminoimidazole carboxamide ribotide isomerase
MKTFEIIPAIDIIEGKCVRLQQGDYALKTIYNQDPLEVAKQFEAVGLKRLHLVDLDGARLGKPMNLKVLERIAENTGLIIDFGGGIKTEQQVQRIFDAGAAMVALGSVAVKAPELFEVLTKKYGAEKIFLGADVRNEQLALSGWKEQTEINIFDFLSSKIKMGITNVFCTDISKDGLLAGTSSELYKTMLSRFPDLNLVASGGVAGMDDVLELMNIGCSGVIIGKAIYEKKILLSDLVLKNVN